MYEVRVADCDTSLYYTQYYEKEYGLSNNLKKVFNTKKGYKIKILRNAYFKYLVSCQKKTGNTHVNFCFLVNAGMN